MATAGGKKSIMTAKRTTTMAAAAATLATVTVLGVTAAPSTAHIQLSSGARKLKGADADLPFTFQAAEMLLTIDLSAAAVAMNEEFVVAWK